MIIIKIIIAFAILWILIYMILPLFILPGLYFIRSNNQNTPLIKKTAKKLKGSSKKKTLDNTFNFLTKNYHGRDQIYKFILNFKIFSQNVDEFIKEKGRFLSCIQQNKMMKELLLNSGQFSKSEIKAKIVYFGYPTVHQFLIININNKKYKVDPYYKILEEIKD